MQRIFVFRTLRFRLSTEINYYFFTKSEFKAYYDRIVTKATKAIKWFACFMFIAKVAFRIKCFGHLYDGNLSDSILQYVCRKHSTLAITK